MDFLKLNVNEHLEKKGNLSYLSWAWAWAEALKADPEATWEPVMFGQPDGTNSICLYVGQTALVQTRVTVLGKTRSCLLPVMDNRNKAISNPDSFAVNTAVMRCMTKTLAMHGLGLYIYAGEDLPEDEKAPAKPVKKEFPKGVAGAVLHYELDSVPQERRDYLDTLAGEMLYEYGNGRTPEALLELVNQEIPDKSSTERVYLSTKLGSELRNKLAAASRANYSRA